MATLAHVTPEVLRWARESVGYGVEDAAKRIGVTPEKLEGAETGDLTPQRAQVRSSGFTRAPVP